MRNLIITVAGTSTRFNKDTQKEVLKCIYYKDSPNNSLLVQIIQKCEGVDKIIIVGGYLYDELHKFINDHLNIYKDKINLVFNEYFDVYGSGYSLKKGIDILDVDENDEVIFVEGDLYFDIEGFNKVVISELDTLTINREPIYSDKAVALYINDKSQIKYLYDIHHKHLVFPEPVKAVFNSAQIWKFISVSKLKLILQELSDSQIQGTNLEIIQKYFADMSIENVSICTISKWYNCNTVKDYLDIYLEITK